MPPITPLLASVGDISAPFAAPQLSGWRDQQLIDGQRAIAEARRRLDAVAAAVAGEIAHRSRRELGHTGLAASRGQRSAEGLISQLSGGSTREARTLVKAAELLPPDPGRHSAPGAPPVPRWQAVIGGAVAAARISVEAAEVIRTRLAAVGAVGAGAGAPQPERGDGEQPQQERDAALAEAAERLVAEAPLLTIEQLAARAARARDELDLAGIAERERQLHEKRSLRVVVQSDGMTRLHALLDPESAAIVVPILDAATSPRRGGPRFVDPDAAARADDLVRDARTTEQLALDVFVELVRIGGRVDGGKLLGERKPAVRILVTKRDLEAPLDAVGVRPGAAYFEGQEAAVSVGTAERFICSAGAVPVLFDDDTGRVLHLGREQRLFSEKQRVALAARDGGCLMCGRPPSWCEAHHIDHWDEHGGRTDVDAGVLVCRFCHLLVHNRGWRIRREGGDYLLERPDDDGILRRTPLPSRSPARDRLLATA